jgi:CBS domain-containing protein
MTIPEADSIERLVPADLLASEVMTPAPRTCSPFSTVTEAVMIFKQEGIAYIPVVDVGKPVGIVTDREIALAVPDDLALAQQPVSTVMNRDFLSTTESTPVSEVVKMISETEASLVLVVNHEGLLSGIISWPDLAARFSSEMVSTVFNPEETARLSS